MAILGSREIQPEGGLMLKPSTCPENRDHHTPRVVRRSLLGLQTRRSSLAIRP